MPATERILPTGHSHFWRTAGVHSAQPRERKPTGVEESVRAVAERDGTGIRFRFEASAGSSLRLEASESLGNGSALNTWPAAHATRSEEFRVETHGTTRFFRARRFQLGRGVRPPSGPQNRDFLFGVPDLESGLMNRVLVLFDSLSGNTAKMAALVAEGARAVPDTEVRVRSVAEATADDVLWCDGLALGSPTNMGILSWRMKRFWDEVMGPHWMKVDGKIGCAFSTAGGWGGGMELACQSLLTVLMNFGFLVFGVTDYATRLHTPHYGAVVVKEPRGEDAEGVCRLLGRRLAEWTAVHVHGRRELHPLRNPDRRPPG